MAKKPKRLTRAQKHLLSQLAENSLAGFGPDHEALLEREFLTVSGEAPDRVCSITPAGRAEVERINRKREKDMSNA